MDAGEYFYKSPIGLIRLTCDGGAVTGLYFIDGEPGPADTRDAPPVIVQCENDNALNAPPVIVQCVNELDGYFNGTLKEFSVKTKNAGTVFRERCWRALMTIPYGQTRSYRDMAELIGAPKAVRAVGGANHNNNISIIYPCHRVFGANGQLTGYGGSLWRKEWLLEFEKTNV